jgi:hypothetical protein
MPGRSRNDKFPRIFCEKETAARTTELVALGDFLAPPHPSSEPDPGVGRAVNVRPGDRRRHQRFDVAGHMPGTLELRESLRIANLGASGALLESLAPMSIGAEYQAQLDLEGQRVTVRLKVCRVVEAAGRPRRHLVAVEFTSVEELDALRRFVDAGQGA